MSVAIFRTWARGGLLAVSTVLIALSLAGPAEARQPVDPSTLNPPPPAEFNPVCFSQGAHISCDLAFSDPDITGEPSGIVCNGAELLLSQSRSVVGKRFYDGEGNLLTRHFREDLTGTFTNPATGLEALFVQHNTVVHNLAVPGDQGTGPTRISGSLRIWMPGGGTVLTDSGVAVLNDATGEILFESAHHPFDDYFVYGHESALAPLCEALA
jgi:hypothetical protein